MVAVDANHHIVCAVQLPCPLWRGINELEVALDKALAHLKKHQTCHAITMTGELADCFATRAEGVQMIADTMTRKLSGAVRFFAIEKPHYAMIPITELAKRIIDIASANWYASAAFVAGRFQNGVLLDIGSTTTDICPFLHGTPKPNGYNDFERMCARTLIYTGVVRTPVMALAQELAFEGRHLGIAAEYFATTADIYRLTDELEPAHDMSESADGRNKSLEASAARLARMVGADAGDADLAHWRQLAMAFKSVQLKRIVAAVSQSCSALSLPVDAPIIGVGAGAFLARQVAAELMRPYVEVSEVISAKNKVLKESAGLAFPAYALANLAHEYGYSD
jgi:(4-(4-[2-(gamma-L-glutamylamino)ethyl]phenoxymethyl)furan-2-yl)methanamine synthase